MAVRIPASLQVAVDTGGIVGLLAEGPILAGPRQARHQEAVHMVAPRVAPHAEAIPEEDRMEVPLAVGIPPTAITATN